MPKINREEYEVLKGLDDKWKWIVRNDEWQLEVRQDKPFKKGHVWSKEVTNHGFSNDINNDLFHFIQWNDINGHEEPYNIQELIEEYEMEQHIKESVELGEQAMRDHARNQIRKESEETEVKKDKQWLRDRYESMETIKVTTKNSRGKRSTSYLKKKTVINLLNQLDEPETLSPEWIDENSYNVHLLGTPDVETVAVPREKLQNLLVPKQEEPTKEALEKYGMSESRWKEVLERYKWHLEQEGYVVLEKPTIPQFVAEWIEKKQTPSREDLLWIIYDDASIDDHDIWCWLFGNDDQEHVDNRILLMRAWLDGYTVEKEQKYYVLGKYDTPILFRDHRNRITETSNLSDIYPKADSEDFEFTEQEIKDYDERYWPFAVKVKELEE